MKTEVSDKVSEKLHNHTHANTIVLSSSSFTMMLQTSAQRTWEGEQDGHLQPILSTQFLIETLATTFKILEYDFLVYVRK